MMPVDSGTKEEMKQEIRRLEDCIQIMESNKRREINEAIDDYKSLCAPNYEGMYTLVEWNHLSEQLRQMTQEKERWESKYLLSDKNER